MNTPIARARGERLFYFSAEKVAYWFFRLNGCLSLENFLAHHEIAARGNGTEVDLLAARFPHRQELMLSGEAMPDHKYFGNDKIEIIFAEVKSKQSCSINDSWLNPDNRNMERMLYVIGAIPPNETDKAAQSLYKEHSYENSMCRIRQFAIGSELNTDLPENIVQLTWPDALSFIHHRFTKYEKYKRQHSQWDYVGQELINRALIYREDPKDFIAYVISNLVN